MIIDSHQHFWKYNPVKDSWIDDSMETIRKDFLPDDLKPLLEANGVDACIAIQADQSEEESRFLLELATKNDFIKGVVGWVDLMAGNVEERLSSFSEHSKFKGVRHIIQSEAKSFVLRNDFQYGISKLEQFNLTYDILVSPNQLSNVISFVSKFPNQVFILDHIAKPYIKDKKIADWKKQIIKLAPFENVCCKVSGMVTEAHLNMWNYEDFSPYLDTVFDVFGPKRILFGSDWPVCLLSANYTAVMQILKNYISELSESEQYDIMGGNAMKAYALKN